VTPRDPAAYLDAPYTYPELGATAEAELPAGYRHVRRSLVLGHGDDVRRRALDALLHWRMHRAAGLHVTPQREEVRAGEVVVQRLGIGPIGLTIPCRVVRVTLDDGRGGGFAYGSLPGHPEIGEESFTVEQGDDERVTFTVRAFAKPAIRLTRIAPPVTHLAQDVALRRYLHALRRLANE